MASCMGEIMRNLSSPFESENYFIMYHHYSLNNKHDIGQRLHQKKSNNEHNFIITTIKTQDFNSPLALANKPVSQQFNKALLHSITKSYRANKQMLA